MREQEIFPPRHFPPSGDSALDSVFELPLLSDNFSKIFMLFSLYYRRTCEVRNSGTMFNSSIRYKYHRLLSSDAFLGELVSVFRDLFLATIVPQMVRTPPPPSGKCPGTFLVLSFKILT